MVVLQFLIYLASMLGLLFVITATKNAIDAELNKITIQKKVKKALIQSLYYVEKANEEMRKSIQDLSELLDDGDIDGMKEYLSKISPEELSQQWDAITEGKMPFELNDILGDDNDK